MKSSESILELFEQTLQAVMEEKVLDISPDNAKRQSTMTSEKYLLLSGEIHMS